MYKNNPISESRFRFLKEALLRKYSEIDSLKILNIVKDTDPTKTGSYSTWIINQLFKDNIILPEDSEKIREKLQLFEIVKRNLAIKDINKYATYAELAQVLKPFKTEASVSGNLRVSLINKIGINLAVSKTIDNDVYSVIKIPRIEKYDGSDLTINLIKVVSLLAKGSEWCIKRNEVAQDYLEDGDLYFFDKNGLPWALLHLESNQFMDLNNEDVDDSDLFKINPLIKELFKKRIIHIRWAAVSNKYLTFKKKCECDNLCGRDEITACSECDKIICVNCQSSCDKCSRFTCKDDTSHCSKCDKELCATCFEHYRHRCDKVIDLPNFEMQQTDDNSFRF